MSAADATMARRAAWLLAALALLGVLGLHLLPALLAGLLVFALVHLIAPQLQRHLSHSGAKLIAVGLLSAVVAALITLLVLGVIGLLRSEAGSLPALLQKMADIVEDSRAHLPAWVFDLLPRDGEQFKAALTQWLRGHAAAVQTLGADTVRALAHVLFGLIVGALVALHEARPVEHSGPLAAALTERARLLAAAFRDIVFAQVRISAINTTLTALYLAALLPALDIHLPLVKTMIAVTFVAGLLPVLGNLISNSVIVIVSLSHSLLMAGAALAFLVLIHKLEYFLNARIIGTHIQARAWELLIAMLVFEAAFGLAGVVAAPIYYAYAKRELAQGGWL